MKKKETIFQLLFLACLFAFTVSCEIEEDEEAISSDFSLTTVDQTRRMDCNSFGGSNNLQLCGTNFYLPAITTESQWNIGNNGTNYIDYKLEQNFASSCSFSYTCLRPCGPPVEETFGEVYFIESPGFNPDTFEQDLYNYLPSEGITPERANELQEHFACKIIEYQLANYSGWIISEVDFFGDTSLCNTSGFSRHWLKARFKLTRHQCL